jgi:phage-related protein
MKLYRQDAGIGYLVKNYGDGLWMIKPQHGQGRCLFFMIAKSTESTELIALLAYKKESRKAPDRLLALAKQRMDGYLRDQK